MVPPLLAVLVPLVVAAAVLAVVFARLFPVEPAVPLVRLIDATATAGLGFRHVPTGVGGAAALSGAVVVLDYDGDGDPDLFFVNGAPWPWGESLQKSPGRGGALFRNDGAGHFTDVSAAAGLNVALPGMAAAAGDYDNDGWPDLMITCLGPNHLFRNLGNGRFEDVSEAAGLSDDVSAWSSGVTWIDIDGDGWLDLVVLNYLRWSPEVGFSASLAVERGGRSYGAPAGFFSAPPVVYRNHGDGTFGRLADGAGLRQIDAETGRPVPWPLAVTPVDANGDALLDLLIAYQDAPPALFINEGGTFAWRSGAGLNRGEMGSSGLAASSGLTVLGSRTEPRLAALLAMSGPSGPGRQTGNATGAVDLSTKLGVALGDFDLDGREEIFAGGGRVKPSLDEGTDEADPGGAPQVFAWDGGRGMTGATVGGGADLTDLARDARGVVVADFDGDGDLDVVLARNQAEPVFLRNSPRLSGPWLRVRLTATRSQPEAGGARVELHTTRGVLTRTVAPAMGFMAQSESTLTFGLGEGARANRLVVIWPSGQRQTVTPVPVNTLLELREP